MFKVIILILVFLNVTSCFALSFEKSGSKDDMDEIAMPGDGDCLFWAVAVGENAAEGKALAYGLPARKLELRQQVAIALGSGDFNEELNVVLASDDSPYHNSHDYIEAVRNGMWAGDLELLVLSRLLNKNIIHHSQTRVLLAYPNDKPYSKSIHIWYMGEHYNLLLPRNFI